MASWWRRLFRWVLPEDPAYRRHSAGRPALVVPFRGFCFRNRVYLQGRVLRDRRIVVSPDDSLWRNLVNNYKRFGSLKIPGALLDIRIGENQLHLVTDNNGYFRFFGALPLPLPSDQGVWVECYIHLLGTLNETFDYRCTGELLVPGEASFGIISDIDDTILKTGLASLLKLKAIYLTLALNAFGRQAFQSVSDFYRALQGGPEGSSHNPVFYVSNGPWNLYDLLTDFTNLNNLPKGPVLLRDFGFSRYRLRLPPPSHKQESIALILDLYADLPFILIGDSGERDTDIYMEIAHRYPGRILGIFIRDVEIPGRARRIRQLIADAEGEPIVHIIKNYREATRFARESGWIAGPPPSAPGEEVTSK
ncbi:MAG: DUF2183 domain-containing protein [Saprospiraceae bacterium]|nr:DUF2183 domain-containing protein [Saprospiraceae bacterium]